jgi:hypothetical protein
LQPVNAQAEVAIGSAGCGGVARLYPKPDDSLIEERLPLAELLAKAGKGDFLCSAEPVVQLLIETDVEGLIGAAKLAGFDPCPRLARLTDWRPLARGHCHGGRP